MPSLLIYGASGAGKTTALRNLPPKKSFYITCLGKSITFPNSKEWIVSEDRGETGHYYSLDTYSRLKTLFTNLEKREDIQYIIIDDYSMLMTRDYVARAKENGYAKFTQFASDLFTTMIRGNESNKFVIFITHQDEVDEHSPGTIKTVGKLTREKLEPLGIHDMVIHSDVDWAGDEVKYLFYTNSTPKWPAKTPMGMVPLTVPNDLYPILLRYDEFINGGKTFAESKYKAALTLN